MSRRLSRSSRKAGRARRYAPNASQQEARWYRLQTPILAPDRSGSDERPRPPRVPDTLPSSRTTHFAISKTAGSTCRGSEPSEKERVGVERQLTLPPEERDRQVGMTWLRDLIGPSTWVKRRNTLSAVRSSRSSLATLLSSGWPPREAPIRREAVRTSAPRVGAKWDR